MVRTLIKLEIVPDLDEGGYVVRYPDLPGCVTEHLAMGCVMPTLMAKKSLQNEKAHERLTGL